MIVVREYVDDRGRSAYADWFSSLDQSVAVKVVVALERMTQGHTSALKPVGDGVSEYRIDSGPGYRIYFGRDGDRLIILLGGGTKRRQQSDIRSAKSIWQDYKQRRKQEDAWH